MNWQTGGESPREWVKVGRDAYHLDDTAWSDAPKPRRWHKCKPQSHYYRDRTDITGFYRCACGAYADNTSLAVTRGDLIWTHRNERPKL